VSSPGELPFEPEGETQFMNIPKVVPVAAAILAFCILATPNHAQGPSPNVSVFATGLNNPRGLTFSPTGELYLAEGGTSDNNLSTIGQCLQVIPPIGPYTGGHTSRISKISATGKRTTVLDHLPSSMTSPASGGFVSGVADLKFLDGRLYVLTAGSGCSHGLAGTANGIFELDRDHDSLKMVADLSAFQMANPVADPFTNDFEPDGTWYSMVAVDGSLFALEPNHEELDQITRFGYVNRVSDISASEGGIVPTSIAYRNGYFYFGNLGLYPVTPGTENVYRLNPRTGKITVYASGFTAIQGIAFDQKGRLYVLESLTLPGFPSPAQVGSGTIVRVDRHGEVDTVAKGLSFPTAMTFGPDRNLYVSNFGYAAPAGAGQIVRVNLHDRDDDYDGAN
jgi:hypothetical protein